MAIYAYSVLLRALHKGTVPGLMVATGYTLAECEGEARDDAAVAAREKHPEHAAERIHVIRISDDVVRAAAASVDTFPKGQDGVAGLSRSKGSAVGEAETPNSPPPIRTNPNEG